MDRCGISQSVILYTFFVSVRNLFLLLLYKIFVLINGIYTRISILICMQSYK